MANNRHDMANATGASARADLFDLIMLGGFLSLIPIRAVINETMHFEVARLFRHISDQGTASPGTTFLFSILIVVAAAVGWLRRIATGGPRYRWTGAEVGLALLIVAGILSGYVAGQKHLALIGAVNFITLILYAITLRQYLTRPWHVRLTLAVILATAAVVVTKCGMQHFWEQKETIEYWEQNRAELLGEEGNATSGPAAGMQHDYEQRMRSRLVTGYYPHANVLGSHLVVFIFAIGAIVADRVRRRVSPMALIVPGLVAAGCVFSLRGTDSKGAAACVGLGVGIWLVATILNRMRIASRAPRAVLIAVWIVALLGVASVAIILRANEGALGRSMQFRHMYWRGAAAMMADGHWLGVGPLNFGRHFLQYKPVECPEEVESPHSWLVQLASEWGVFGLLAFGAVLVGISVRIARRSRVTVVPDDTGAPGALVWWSLGLLAVFICAWGLQLSGADPFIVSMALMFGSAPWLAASILGGLEALNESRFSNEPCVAMLSPVIAGLIAFLSHTGIDLALFEGGPATTFFAMIAVALALADWRERPVESAPPSETRAWGRRPGLALAGGGVLLVATVISLKYFVVAPLTYVADLRAGRVDTTPSDWRTYLSSGGGADYSHALDVYSLDATAHSELVEQLIPRVQVVAHVDRALKLVDEFERRDPYDGLSRNLRGTLYSQRYQLSRNLADLHASIRELTAYAAEYPTSPTRQLYLATALVALARGHGDTIARDEAIRRLETALALDEQRVYVSKPNRLSPETVAQIRSGIEELKKLKPEPSPSDPQPEGRGGH